MHSAANPVQAHAAARLNSGVTAARRHGTKLPAATTREPACRLIQCLRHGMMAGVLQHYKRAWHGGGRKAQEGRHSRGNTAVPTIPMPPALLLPSPCAPLFIQTLLLPSLAGFSVPATMTALPQHHHHACFCLPELHHTTTHYHHLLPPPLPHTQTPWAPCAITLPLAHYPSPAHTHTLPTPGYLHGWPTHGACHCSSPFYRKHLNSTVRWRALAGLGRNRTHAIPLTGTACMPRGSLANLTRYTDDSKTAKAWQQHDTRRAWRWHQHASRALDRLVTARRLLAHLSTVRCLFLVPRNIARGYDA